MNDWKSFVKSVTYKVAFVELQIECSYNEKTSHISHDHFQTCEYLTSLPPKQAKLAFKAKTGMLDIKANFENKYAYVLKCPLCLGSSETYVHLACGFQKCLEVYTRIFKQTNFSVHFEEITKIF